MDSTKLISLDPEVLKNEASLLDNQSKILQDLGQQLSTTCTNISTVWYGDASQAFTSIMNTQGVDAINKMSDFAFGMSKEIASVAQTIEESDKKIANGYSGK